MVQVGFIGLGLMGGPMALNIAAGHFPLVVWNRSAAKTTRLRAAGANVATAPDEVFASCGVIVEMLADEDAINAVFGLRGDVLDRNLFGRMIVHMSTTSAEYSSRLRDAVLGAGGRATSKPRCRGPGFQRKRAGWSPWWPVNPRTSGRLCPCCPRCARPQ
jgi:3-hydroxyisobutyrate dehydrogenase